MEVINPHFSKYPLLQLRNELLPVVLRVSFAFAFAFAFVTKVIILTCVKIRTLASSSLEQRYKRNELMPVALWPCSPVPLLPCCPTARAHRNHYLDKGSKGWHTQQQGLASAYFKGRFTFSFSNATGEARGKGTFFLYKNKNSQPFN